MVRQCLSLIPSVSVFFVPFLVFLVGPLFVLFLSVCVWSWLSNQPPPAANQPARLQPIHSSSSCSIYTPARHSTLHQIVLFAGVMLMLQPSSNQVNSFLVCLPEHLLILCLPVPQVHLLSVHLLHPLFASQSTTQSSLPARSPCF